MECVEKNRSMKLQVHFISHEDEKKKINKKYAYDRRLSKLIEPVAKCNEEKKASTERQYNLLKNMQIYFGNQINIRIFATRQEI